MLFFMFSFFILCGYSVCALVSKNLFLSPHKPGGSICFKRFARVGTLLSLLPLVCVLTLVSCGPETILLRPSLDTPYQHVDNGYKLMAYGKTDAAVREFKRSIELDAEYAPAYVGLGIVYGIKGDLAQGRALMEKAKVLAKSDEQKKEVEMGFERLDFIESDKL